MENRFLPSKDLADRIMDAISGNVNFGELQPIPKDEEYVKIDPQEYVGDRIVGLSATLAYRYGGEEKSELRIGENGHFSDEFIKMLSYDRLPVLRGDARVLYSELYSEFHRYAVANNNRVEAWGRLTADESGVSIVNIKPIVRKKGNRERAQVIGGKGFK